jgi:hypothetical protein
MSDSEEDGFLEGLQTALVLIGCIIAVTAVLLALLTFTSVAK